MAYVVRHQNAICAPHTSCCYSLGPFSLWRCCGGRQREAPLNWPGDLWFHCHSDRRLPALSHDTWTVVSCPGDFDTTKTVVETSLDAARRSACATRAAVGRFHAILRHSNEGLRFFAIKRCLGRPFRARQDPDDRRRSRTPATRDVDERHPATRGWPRLLRLFS